MVKKYNDGYLISKLVQYFDKHESLLQFGKVFPRYYQGGIRRFGSFEKYVQKAQESLLSLRNENNIDRMSYARYQREELERRKEHNRANQWNRKYTKSFLVQKMIEYASKGGDVRRTIVQKNPEYKYLVIGKRPEYFGSYANFLKACREHIFSLDRDGMAELFSQDVLAAKTIAARGSRVQERKMRFKELLTIDPHVLLKRYCPEELPFDACPDRQQTLSGEEVILYAKKSGWLKPSQLASILKCSITNIVNKVKENAGDVIRVVAGLQFRYLINPHTISKFSPKFDPKSYFSSATRISRNIDSEKEYSVPALSEMTGISRDGFITKWNEVHFQEFRMEEQ